MAAACLAALAAALVAPSAGAAPKYNLTWFEDVGLAMWMRQFELSGAAATGNYSFHPGMPGACSGCIVTSVVVAGYHPSLPQGRRRE